MIGELDRVATALEERNKLERAKFLWDVAQDGNHLEGSQGDAFSVAKKAWERQCEEAARGG